MDSKSATGLLSEHASISPTAVIWDGTKVREHASIGDGTSLGMYCYVGPGVIIGSNCKVQNQALIYEPAVIEDSVFIGPGAVITNDLNPRAANLDGIAKTERDWVKAAATIKTGASLGAGVITVGSITIGEWSMIAAGSVVTSDVKPHALMAGVPSKQIGWVSHQGIKLQPTEDGKMVCPDSKWVYEIGGSGHVQRIES